MGVDFRQNIKDLLKEVGPGRILNTAYDTAWIARLRDLDEGMGDRALEWLRENQLPDGSWGAAHPRYYHDRLICTLSAMMALASYGKPEDRPRWQRAQLALETITKGLPADLSGETIGFEMIAPTLVTEAKSMGLDGVHWNGTLTQLERSRAAKIASLPGGMISRQVTVAFSAEMAGPDGLRLLDVDHLQEANGSIGHSPSATAYYALYVRPEDPLAMQYLRDTVTGEGGAPDVAPFDVFEQAWTLWNISLINGIDQETLELCQPHLNFLQNAWKPGVGTGFGAGYSPKDGDDSSLVFDVLRRYGCDVDLEAILRYEQGDHYRCYELEANPSISANIHVLGALRQAGLPADHPSVQTAFQFLKRIQTIGLFWFDKWHSSPYYPTSHMIISAAGWLEDEIVDNAVRWVLETQNRDGSWGFYTPTAEETAYCLQALVMWKRSGHTIPDGVIEQGAAWLLEHSTAPNPPLWIGKCLYCPVLVVRSAILSALILAAED